MTYIQTPADRRVVDGLNAEWERLESAGSTELPAWAREPVFAPGADLGSVLLAIRTDPDPTLLTLLGAAQSGDALAARVVLQALLPKMVLMARRDRYVGVSDYLGQLWCVVQTYPIRRRPAGVAANLALDTLKQVVRDRFDGPRVVDLSVAEARPDHRDPAVRHEAEQVLSAAGELELIDAATGAILRTVYLDGLSSREAADRHGSSPEMVRYRCSRAVRRLAGHAVELAVA